MGRLKQALKAGFKHIVFEDNYDTGSGDHYSLRQICDQFYISGELSSGIISAVDLRFCTKMFSNRTFCYCSNIIFSTDLGF